MWRGWGCICSVWIQKYVCWACGRLSLPRSPFELVDDFLSLALLLSLWTTFSPSLSCWAWGPLSLPRSPVELVDDFLPLALLLSLWTTFSPSLSCWACGRLSLLRSHVELVDDFLSLALLLSLWTTFSPSLSCWACGPLCSPPSLHPPPPPRLESQSCHSFNSTLSPLFFFDLESSPVALSVLSFFWWWPVILPLRKVSSIFRWKRLLCCSCWEGKRY